MFILFLRKLSRDYSLSEIWTAYVNEADITDPFRQRNPKRRMFSYIHTQKESKSRLDRMYVNDENCDTMLHYKHTLTPWKKAHKVISFSIKENIERGPGFWKMNTSILSDRAFHTKVDSTLKDVLDLNIQDPIERWLVFIETIRIESQIYCSRKRNLERIIRDTEYCDA